MASLMPELPPSTTGQPTAWAVTVRKRPKAVVSGAVSRAMEWADTPASNALVRSDSNRWIVREMGRRPGSPNRARVAGWRGTLRSGAKMARLRGPEPATNGSIICW